MRRTPSPPAVVIALLVAGAGPGAHHAAAQDVELLSRIYGTPLPEGYFRTLAEFPRAFEFATGRTLRLEQMIRDMEARTAPARAGAPLQDLLAVLGPRGGEVRGTFRVPVLMGLFSDSPGATGPYTREVAQAAYFGDGPGTITHYFREVSGNRVTLRGDLQDWIRSSVSQGGATGGQSGLIRGTTGTFIMDLLRRLPPNFDWGPYDNDGPDGLPNSGDDDGFADVLAVLHPTRGAECSPTADRPHRIWSHKWNLAAAVGELFVTSTPRPGGGFIRVNDYTVQPILACKSDALNEIGVFTHELGHAFGLPDLYDTRDSGAHQGVGNWDLMGTGAWGCDGSSPAAPCHMGPWSKAVLGWVEVVTLPADTEVGALTLPPVQTSGRVFRVDAGDGSREYYLLENRQRTGFDARIYNDGLLVWRVSQPLVDARWRGNRVNAGVPLGVWIREADGLNELAISGCGRGNAGDPFPLIGPFTGRCGSRATDNRVFHAGSNPSSLSDAGTASGLTLLDIQKGAGGVTFRLSTRFTRVGVRAEGHGGTGGLFSVNGAPVPGTDFTHRAAPFQRFTLEAAAGEPLAPGVRRPFTGWTDDPQAPRVRTVDAPMTDFVLVARYGGEQVRLSVALQGGQGEIGPGTVVASPASPDFWFSRGATVTVEARPRQGFAFARWTGALAGRPNPATVTLNGPLEATAVFDLIYRVSPATVAITAAAEQQLELAPEHGTAPFQWELRTGRLPEGVSMNSQGRITGAAMETGSFPLSVRVSDASGLTAEGSFVLQVNEAVFPVAALASRFLLTGPPLTPAQMQYVDRRGNRDGFYDVGDLRAWVLANPGLPLTAPMQALVGPTTVVIPLRPTGPEERR